MIDIGKLWSRPGEEQRVQECQILTEEGRTYFDQILTEYQLLTACDHPVPDEAQIRKIADGIAAKQPGSRTWSDLFGLEIAVVKLQCEEALRRGTWAIRAKYRDLVGDKAYDAYQTSNPPDPKTGEINQLRSDTLEILGEFHWAYAFAPLREKIRSELMKQVFAITTILVVVALAIAAIGYFEWTRAILGKFGIGSSLQIPVLSVVISLGMIGGYTSLQQRIQSVPTTGDPIVNIAELSNSQFSLYLAPISGAVFAVILYVIFIAGLLSGPLFPKISTLPSKCDQAVTEKSASSQVTAAQGAGKTDIEPQVPRTESQNTGKPCAESVEFSEFLKKTGPESGVSFAMLLVWSFVAGFAERFVPDTIDRLVSQAAKK